MRTKLMLLFEPFARMDYLLCEAQPVHIFTDHQNLLFVFDPSTLRPDSPRHVLSKGHRSVIPLLRFEFFIIHMDGFKNIFANILTRRLEGCRKITTRRVAALYGYIIRSSKDITMVTSEDIIKEQARYERHVGVNKDADGIIKNHERIWIPKESKELK